MNKTCSSLHMMKQTRINWKNKTPNKRHVFEPKLNAQQCAICEALKKKCFQQSTLWCFGSHFFVARSHRFIATCHRHFLASFLKGKAWKENSFVNFSLQPTAAHLLSNTLKFARLFFIQFCSSRYGATQVSCLVT